MTLRRRISLTLLPLVVLLLLVGGVGWVLLQSLGYRANLILRENYVSVKAMTTLIDAVRQIKPGSVGAEFDRRWETIQDQLEVERRNVTLPGEGELYDQLEAAVREYRTHLDKPDEVLRVAREIYRINDEHMYAMDEAARRATRTFSLGFGLGLLVAVSAAAWFARRSVGAILQPIEAVTRAANRVEAGDLSVEVPVQRDDELGTLGKAFNSMTEEIRRYRRSNLEQLMRTQQTAQATIDSFPDPILVVDLENRVELNNEAARSLFGVRPHDRPVWQTPEALQKPIREALLDQRAYVPDSLEQTLRFRLRDEERFFLPHVRPIRAGGDTLGAAVLLYDVTRFRLLDQMKSDMVAVVSHELKTPLTSVRLAVHVLLEETIGPLNPKQTEFLIEARDSAERLLAMVEHLLSLARLESHEQGLQLRPEDLGPLLQRAVDTVIDRAKDKRIDVAIDPGQPIPPVEVDAIRFGQALDNLLTNAVEYTEPGGRIFLTARRLGERRVEIAISDTGIGVAPEHLPHLFEKFYRIEDDAHPRGTGLGLAIVREIVEAHGGEISCDSERGKGTTFRIFLPLRREQP